MKRKSRIVGTVIGFGSAMTLTALLAPVASAEVITYSCPSSGCVIQVVPGYIGPVGSSAGAHSGKGDTGADAVALGLADTEGLAGPAITDVQAEMTKTTSADQGTTVFIGSAGGAGEFANAAAGPGTTSADAQYYRYNLINGEGVGARAGSADHTTNGFGGACAIDLLTGGCIGVNGTTGPSGTTATTSGSAYAIVEQDVWVQVDSGKGRKTTVTSSVPLMP